MRCYGVATRGIVLGDRGDVCDARAVSDLLRRPKSPSQCLIVRCRPSDGRASPSVGCFIWPGSSDQCSLRAPRPRAHLAVRRGALWRYFCRASKHA